MVLNIMSYVGFCVLAYVCHRLHGEIAKLRADVIGADIFHTNQMDSAIVNFKGILTGLDDIRETANKNVAISNERNILEQEKLVELDQRTRTLLGRVANLDIALSTLQETKLVELEGNVRSLAEQLDNVANNVNYILTQKPSRKPKTK
jgi:hypothetical protein